MSSINKAILIGRLGKDPELKSFDSGTKNAKFSLATSEKYNDTETTQWHNIVVWGKLADLAEKYLKKGDQCYVEGMIEYREYEKDGVKKYMTEIKCFKMTFLGGSGKKETTIQEPTIINTDAGGTDLPF